jgi:hypothetical protein
MSDDAATDTEETEWRFGLDDVGREAGPEPIEPGTPDAENTAFVLLGVGLALAILYAAVAGI